jgi:hypothetical protein
MSYFRELPDLEYQSPLTDKISSTDYVRVKNIFRRVKLRDDLSKNLVLFNKYQIEEGERPDIVAEKLYGKADLDWIVLICAGITNVRNQWPLSSRDIYRFSESKYGDELNATRIYETTEVKDGNGRLILPAGKVVDGNFTIPNPEDISQSLNPVVGISNYEYETRLNDEKRSIDILKKVYLQTFLNDIRKLTYYSQSSQYVDSKLIRTENTRNQSI